MAKQTLDERFGGYTMGAAVIFFIILVLAMAAKMAGF